ncbi:DMT family transporter [Anaerorhabdus sp.]|nr:DMT family transporter [Anaerorhabdus sp.]MEA4875795.1 DMT family transporter [Anaerorhabdus sp.]
MMNKSRGHFYAILTICIWATTFVSTKILLADFKPIEILFIRFLIGFVALIIIYPKRLPHTTKSQEYYFIAAGCTGICLYYLLENIALTYTSASNVGVLISVAPFFTGLLSIVFFKEEKMSLNFILGFIIAMAGISLISFNGNKVEVNLVGDLLALIAAFLWAIYSLLIKKISTFGYHTIGTTRRIFFYGLLIMIPALFLFNFQFDLDAITRPINLFNILYLGLGASALCFITWNFSVKILGPLKTSVYIYLVPILTMITSAIILHEEITIYSLFGMLLTLFGLLLSEKKHLFKGDSHGNRK